MKLEQVTRHESVGDFIAAYLADIGVEVIFGVISIHNMPILDALARQGRVRFVPARGEAGAMNMADAYARVTGERGLRLRAPGEDVILPLPVVTHPAELEQPQDAELVVVLAMKSQHTEQALLDLKHSGLRDPHVVCMQNGVANERLAARHFEQVYAAVVNLPAMHRANHEMLGLVMAEGIATGDLRADLDPTDLAHALIGMVHHRALCVLDGEPLPPDISRRIVDLFFFGAQP